MSKSVGLGTVLSSSQTTRLALREQLEAVTGERIVALEAVDPERVKGRETVLALAAGTANVSYRDVVEAAQAVASSDLSMSDLM